MTESLSDVLVQDVMTKALISVDPATTVFQIANMMEKGGIGAILVKKDGQPAGIITDRDFATRIAVNKHSGDTRVDAVASYPLITVGSSESILAAAQLMSEKKIRKLAVVEDGSVIGIITSTDLVNQITKMKK